MTNSEFIRKMITMDQVVCLERREPSIGELHAFFQCLHEDRLLCGPCGLWYDTYLELRTHLYLLNIDDFLQ